MMKTYLIVFTIFFANVVQAGSLQPLYEGRISANAVVIKISSDQVMRGLPSYLKLAHQNLTAKGTHPVILIFAENLDVRALGAEPGTGVTYNEMLVFVPFVGKRGSKTVFNYMGQLYLDNWVPIYTGLRFYGYPKDIAAITQNENSYSVADVFTNQLILTQSPSVVENGSTEKFRRNWSVVADIFDRPLISNVNGTTLCSELVFQHISQKPIKMEVDLKKSLPFVSAEAEKLSSPGLDEGILGAFHYEASYTLSVPAPVANCR